MNWFSEELVSVKGVYFILWPVMFYIKMLICFGIFHIVFNFIIIITMYVLNILNILLKI